MKNYLLLTTLFPAIWFSGCAASSATPDNTNQSPARVFYPRIETKDRQVMQDLEKFAAESKGTVGVGAVDLGTGEYFSLGGDSHYPMQSVYKLPISLAVIKQYENQGLDLEQKVKISKDDLVPADLHSPIRDKFPEGTEMSVHELIRYALEESDGTASDVLLRIVGGGPRVQEYLATLGINDMKVIYSEKEMAAKWENQYENWSTPAAAVDLLQALYEGRALSSDNGREAVLQMMTNSSPGPNRIKGLLEGSPVAHKTGTSGSQNGITAATNDIGLVSMNKKHFAIAVFVSDSPAGEKTREATIAKITKVLYNYWQQWDKP